MRISDDKVAQIVESNPPVLVIVDDTNGNEFTLTAEEASRLEYMIEYFSEYVRNHTTS